ncbi:uncharacterized protein BJ212DRAFT_407741 [Suillus subaureus]|uniref:Uncharacterized protein n=1 Tax=Suillus subaureus TaxID=48587 RepID=A0A9P7IY17_9AGAM|nr:uncharacterized protein BJ212DRAFT_407741 [Suillus subaureus]KAG1797158.1 hypothetical protein BJ212DRAFT_407741 [Suillus subaureus]
MNSARLTTPRYVNLSSHHASRMILQTRFPTPAVASSGESVDICDALEIVLLLILFLSLPFCSAHFPILFRHHPQSLMFPCSCSFYFLHAFLHPTTVASPIHYIFYFKKFAC